MAKDKVEEQKEVAFQRRLKAKMRMYREMHGFNQQQMADKLVISKENYQKYEHDQRTGPFRKVPIVVALEFCELAGLDLHELLKGLRKRA